MVAIPCDISTLIPCCMLTSGDSGESVEDEKTVLGKAQVKKLGRQRIRNICIMMETTVHRGRNGGFLGRPLMSPRPTRCAKTCRAQNSSW